MEMRTAVYGAAKFQFKNDVYDFSIVLVGDMFILLGIYGSHIVEESGFTDIICENQHFFDAAHKCKTKEGLKMLYNTMDHYAAIHQACKMIKE